MLCLLPPWYKKDATALTIEPNTGVMEKAERVGQGTKRLFTHSAYSLVENLSQMPWYTFPWAFLDKFWSHDHALAGI